MKLWKQYELHFFFGICLCITITLQLFDRTKELGGNLFTEVIGVAMTVFIINKILERKERKKRISIDQRILKEVEAIIASYFSIWKHLVWQYTPLEKIESEEDFLRVYGQLVSRAKINDQFKMVSTHHPESWKLFFHQKPIKECFKNYYDTLNNDIQLFINDFKAFLDPELLDYLLDIMECEYFKNIYMMCYAEGTENILIALEQDINRLDSYFNPAEPKHIHQFLELIRYSKRLKNTIVKFKPTDVEVYQMQKYFMHPSQLE